MADYKVKDVELADNGELLIEWAQAHMPVLSLIRERFGLEKPLEGLQVGACLHATKETAVLVRTLEAGGAEVSLCGSNPLSTKDEVVAALARNGTPVYAWREQTPEEYYWCIEKVLDNKPIITMDDGADLVGTSRSSTVEAELTSLVTAQKEIPLGSLRLSSGAAIAAFADNTTDGFEFVDSECLGIRWNDSGSSRITVVGQVDIPADAADAAAVVLHAKGFRVGSADTTMVLTVTAFAQSTGAAYDADADAGGSSTAFDGATKVVTDETLTFAAGVLPAGAGVSFSLVPDAALDADDFVLTGLRLTYTRSLA